MNHNEKLKLQIPDQLLGIGRNYFVYLGMRNRLVLLKEASEPSF
jgi:hypothetical protein